MRLLFFALLLSAAAPSYGADSTAYYVNTYVYKTSLKLDVYAPDGGPALRPVIILFHGGSWISGDRHQLDKQCRYFVQQGMIAVTADYRLLKSDAAAKNGAGKDSLIADAKSCVRWVTKNAARLHIDPSRIILGGASAGGHLATMAVLNPAINDPADDKSIPITPQALALFNPAYSLTEDAAVQPYSFVNSHLPPMIFFYGSKDKWKSAGDSLFVQLRKASVNCEMWIAEGQTHGFFNKAPWTDSTCQKVQAFLSRIGSIKSNGASPDTGSHIYQL